VPACRGTTACVFFYSGRLRGSSWKCPKLSENTVKTVIVRMFNETVTGNDICVWLGRFCTDRGQPVKVLDEDGIWTCSWRYLVKLRADPASPGGFIHPPGSFFIGSNRGFLHYPGQPLYCRRCGARGHIKTDCTGQRCRFCESTDHMASACPEPKRCSLCGGVDHLFRACPTRKKSFASLFREAHLFNRSQLLFRTGRKWSKKRRSLGGWKWRWRLKGKTDVEQKSREFVKRAMWTWENLGGEV
uniref:CCHC-type domain-containing protein n=1 Tax=Cyprinus carpio carpio TaxID=630221 RepID=A0A9J7XJH6_CYPCA